MPRNEGVNLKRNQGVTLKRIEGVNMCGFSRHLMLFGEYKGDLSNLTYDKYLSSLKQNEEFSTKNVTETVQQSDQHYFKAKKNTFLIVIYSKKLNAVIFDNAGTAFCDSIKVLKNNEPVPDLSIFIVKSK